MQSANVPIVFDSPPRRVVVARSVLEKIYTQTEFDEAFERGRECGLLEGTRRNEGVLRDVKEEFLRAQNGILSSICQKFDLALGKLRELLPDLVCIATERVLGGSQIDGKIVLAVVNELLSDWSPGMEKLQVRLSIDDLRAIEGLDVEIRRKFPALEFQVDPDLGRGDCVLSSRFGLVDGRIRTKLNELGKQLL